MWLIIIVFLQLPAKEGFPVIRVICHESVIYVTGHVKSQKRGTGPPSYRSYSILFSLPSPLLKLPTGAFSSGEQLKSPGCADSRLPVHASVPSDLLHRHTCWNIMQD